jgi:hypothetical protein
VTPSQSTENGVKTLQDVAAAIDHALPLCEAVSKQPDSSDARQALAPVLAALARASFLEPFEAAAPALRGLGNFVHIQAMLLRDCMVRSDAPDHVIGLMIAAKSRDLLALVRELQKAIDHSAG